MYIHLLLTSLYKTSRQQKCLNEDNIQVPVHYYIVITYK